MSVREEFVYQDEVIQWRVSIMRRIIGILFLLLLSFAGTVHANSYTNNGNGTVTG